MVGGSAARRSPLRALRRALGLLLLACSGFFGFGLTTAGAQTAPCILVVCSPTPLPTVSLPVPVPTVSPPVSLPTLSTVTSVTSTTSSATSLLSGLTGSTSTSTSTSSTGAGALLDPVVSTSQTSGTSCAVTLPGGICVLPSSSSCPVGSTDPACIVTTPGSGCTSNCTPGGPGGGPSGSRLGTGGGGAGSARPTGSFSAFGGGGLGGSTTTPGGGAAIPLGLSVATVPAVDQLSPVSGLQFGHALILWPLFGLLDVLGLAAVYLVVRRFRASRSD